MIELPCSGESGRQRPHQGGNRDPLLGAEDHEVDIEQTGTQRLV